MIKPGSINTYGDHLVENKGHGSDIASQRLDELDMRCLGAATTFYNNGGLSLVDCGTGRCSFINKVRESLNNESVQSPFRLVGIDSIDFSDDALPGVEYFCGDMRDYINKCDRSSINVVYSQRTLHYLDYISASAFLNSAYSAISTGGYLFISASGLGSELSNDYSHSDRPIKNRYSYLSEHMQNKHGIREKVCLYSLVELENVVTSSGFDIEWASASSFGNVKCVGVKNG